METVVVISELPSRPLTSEEAVIKRLDFLDEIAACEKRRGGSHILGVNYLRAVADEVGRKYDKYFNAYRNVIPSDFQGIECNSPEEIAAVVRNMFLAKYPQIFDRYAEVKYKNRPYGVTRTYFVGPQEEAVAFAKLGADVIVGEAVSSVDPLTEEVPNDVSAAGTTPATSEHGTDTASSSTAPTESGAVDTDVDAVAATLESLAEEVVLPVAEEPKKQQNKNKNKFNKNNNLSNQDNKVQ
jgi:hypothetical protein